MVTPENIIPREIPRHRASRLPGVHSAPDNLLLGSREIDALSDGVIGWSNSYEDALRRSVIDRIEWLAIMDPSRKNFNQLEGFDERRNAIYATGYPIHKILHDIDLGLQGLKMLVTGKVEEVTSPKIETDVLKLSSDILSGESSISEQIRDVVKNREYTPLHAMLAVPYLLLRRGHAITINQVQLLPDTVTVNKIFGCALGGERVSPSLMSTYSLGDTQSILWPEDDPKLLIQSLYVASEMVKDDPSQLLIALDEIDLPDKKSLEDRILIVQKRALDFIELMSELRILDDNRFEPLVKGLVTLYSTPLSTPFEQLDGDDSALFSSIHLETASKEKGLISLQSSRIIVSRFADLQINAKIWKLKRKMYIDEVEKKEYQNFKFPENLDAIVQNITDSAIVTQLRKMSRDQELNRRRRDSKTSRYYYAHKSLIQGQLESVTQTDIRIGKKARASEQSMRNYAEESVVFWTNLLQENFKDVKIENDADKQELLESMKQVFSVFRSDRSVPQTVKSLVEGLDGQRSREEYSVRDVDRFLGSLEENSVIFKWLVALKKQGEGHILNTLNSGNNKIAFFHLARTMLYQLAVTARGGAKIPVKISKIISTPITASEDRIMALQEILNDIVIEEPRQMRDVEEPLQSIRDGTISDLLNSSNIIKIKTEAARMKYAKNSWIRLTCWEAQRNRGKFNEWRKKGKNTIFPRKLRPYLTRIAMAATLAGGAHVAENCQGEQSVRNILDHTADFFENVGILDKFDLGLDLGIGSKKYTIEEEFEKAYRIPGAISLEKLCETKPFVYGLNLGGFSSGFVPFHFRYDENYYPQMDVPEGFVETVGTIEELMQTENSYIISEDMISNFINPPENSEIVGIKILGGNVNVRALNNGAIILDGDLPQAVAVITRPAELLDIGALRYGLDDVSVGRVLRRKPPGSMFVFTRNFSEDDYQEALEYNMLLSGDPVLQQLHLQTIEALRSLDWTLPENLGTGSEIVDNFMVDLARHILTTRPYDLSPVIIDPIDNEFPTPIWVASAKEEDRTFSGFYCKAAAQLIDQVLATLNIQAAVETGFNLEELESVIYGTVGHQKVAYTNFDGSYTLVDSTPLQMNDEDELEALANATQPPSSDELAQMKEGFFNNEGEGGPGILSQIQESLNLQNASIALAISGLGLAAYSYKRRNRKKAEASRDRIRKEVFEDLRLIAHPERKELSDIERLFTASLYLHVLSQTESLDDLMNSINRAVESFENVHGYHMELITALFERLVKIPEAWDIFLPGNTETARHEFIRNYIKDQVEKQDLDLINLLSDGFESNINIPNEIYNITNILEVLFRGSYLRDTIMMMMMLGEEEELGLDSSKAELKLRKLNMLDHLMDKPRFGSVGKRIWSSLFDAIKVNND